MRAWYNPKPNCYACINPSKYDCDECTSIRRELVDILSLGNGERGDMGVILKNDGKLLSVPLSTLRVLEGE